MSRTQDAWVVKRRTSSYRSAQTSKLEAAALRRWVEMMAIGLALVVSAIPFVVLAPEPPAFGRGAALIVASFPILATMGTSWQAGTAQRADIVRRAAAVLTVTVAAAGLRYLVAGHVMAVPTMDLLAKMFGLQGEDIGDAFLYEVWLEIWLACASVLLVASGLFRALRQPKLTQVAIPGPWDRPDPPPSSKPRWNAATIVIFLIGLGFTLAPFFGFRAVLRAGRW